MPDKNSLFYMLKFGLIYRELYRISRMGGPEDFLGVMYYIGKINTGVRPDLGGPPIWGGLGVGLDNSLIEIPIQLVFHF